MKTFTKYAVITIGFSLLIVLTVLCYALPYAGLGATVRSFGFDGYHAGAFVAALTLAAGGLNVRLLIKLCEYLAAKLAAKRAAKRP